MLKFRMSFLSALTMISFATVVLSDVKKDMPAISWESTFENAVKKSEATGKSILLDFFSPA
jgi:hypothetical protein